MNIDITSDEFANQITTGLQYIAMLAGLDEYEIEMIRTSCISEGRKFILIYDNKPIFSFHVTCELSAIYGVESSYRNRKYTCFLGKEYNCIFAKIMECFEKNKNIDTTLDGWLYDENINLYKGSWSDYKSKGNKLAKEKTSLSADRKYYFMGD